MALAMTRFVHHVRFLNAWNTQTNGILSPLHSLLLDGVGYAMRMLFEKLSCILTGAYIKKVHCPHFFTKYASLFQIKSPFGLMASTADWLLLANRSSINVIIFLMTFNFFFIS